MSHPLYEKPEWPPEEHKELVAPQCPAAAVDKDLWRYADHTDTMIRPAPDEARELLARVRRAIIDHADDVVWVSDTETAVDAITALLGDAATFDPERAE